MQVLPIASAGLAAATLRFDASARRVAGGEPDLAKEIVEQTMAKAAVEANARVIRTADEMTGELLDILA